jgi:glycosyltransferase involved in cell wall biosynthesis
MPRVSVVTPVYNGAKFIANNIRSIQAQTYRDFEHIIVDDCSTDNTVEIIRQFPAVRLIQLDRNGGPARALNHGYRAASGEYFAWVSADDGYLPHYLERAVAYLDSHPEAVCVHAAHYFVDVEGNILMERCFQNIDPLRPNDVLMRNPVNGSSTMFRRHVYEQLGGFNEELIGTPDSNMWIRMCGVGRVGYIPQVSTFCTRHPGQDSRVRSHLVTENQRWMAEESVRQFGLEALLPRDWKGEREGPKAEAAGWFLLAKSCAGTSDNSLCYVWVERARHLDPDNLRYRLLGALLPRIGSAKFWLRGRVAPLAIRYRGALSKRSGRNVYKMIEAARPDMAVVSGDRKVSAP